VYFDCEIYGANPLLPIALGFTLDGKNNMDNQRKHPRNPFEVNVKIWHPDFGEKTVKTKDVSESGLFIVTEPTAMPPVGEVIEGQVQGMMIDLPIVKMKIVRTDEYGLGLEFIKE
jgi:hypothetical protein